MATEPRVITQLIPDLSSAALDVPSRRGLLIAPFLYDDVFTDGGDGVTQTFLTSKNDVYSLGFRVFVDGVEYTYTASTPGATEFTLYNTSAAGSAARVYFNTPPDSGADLVFYYMYDELDTAVDGSTSIMNRAFELQPRLMKNYQGDFGRVTEYNPLMICMNIARTFGLRKFYWIPVPYIESDVEAATPNAVDITDALEAARYVSVDAICHIFSDSTANSLSITHVDYMSASARGEYRVLFAANPQTTLATQIVELQGYLTKRASITSIPNGTVDVLVGTDDVTKGAGYLAWGALCRKLTFQALATTLTRKVIPGFKLTGTYLRDEREDLNEEGGMTYRTIGTDTVQVAWSKTTAKSGLPEEEEMSVVMVQDVARNFYEDELDKRITGKILGIPKELNGFSIDDATSWGVSISIQLQRDGIIVAFKDVDFVQNETDSRQLDGSIAIQWPFPINITELTISSYS